MKTAICISLVLHALLFSAAIQVGNSMTIAEPKVIEVDLGIVPDAALQTCDTRKTAPPRRKQPLVSPPHEARWEEKRATATAEPAPLAPAMETTVKTDTKADPVASPTCALVSQESPASGDTKAHSSPAVSAAGAESGNAALPTANGAKGMFPYVISGPPPAYPKDARSKGLTGKVRVKVLISEQGTVKDAVIAQSSGHATLDDAARQGLHRWLFNPAYREGRAVAAWVVVPVLFKLE
jgi:protein TonB